MYLFSVDQHNLELGGIEKKSCHWEKSSVSPDKYMTVMNLPNTGAQEQGHVGSNDFCFRKVNCHDCMFMNYFIS